MEMSKIPTSYLILDHVICTSNSVYHVDISNKILSISSLYIYCKSIICSDLHRQLDILLAALYHIISMMYSIFSSHTMYQLYDTTLMQALFLPSRHQKQILWLKLWYPVLRMHTSIHNNLATSRCRKMMCRPSVQIKQPTAIIAPSHCHQWKER